MRDFIEQYPYGSHRAAFAPPVSDTINTRVLAANTVEVATIPAGAKFVSFSADGDFWAKFGTGSGVTAAVPSADITDGTSPELNSTQRRIPDGMTHIALVAGAARIVNLAYWG
jgi:hypothetical protein